VKVESDEFCVTCLGNKKHNQQSSKEEEKEADNSSDNKNVQSSWQMIPGVPDANLENTEEYPPFVMRVVKVYQLLINQRNLKKYIYVKSIYKQGMDGTILFICHIIFILNIIKNFIKKDMFNIIERLYLKKIQLILMFSKTEE
jgi:hypothetical protein